LFAVLIGFLIVSVYLKQSELESYGKTALIVNQLYNENSEFDFVQKCNEILSESNYRTTVINGDNVTVNLLENIKLQRDIIIFRTHSAIFDNYTWFFTGEEYSNTKYVMEQLAGEINIGKCPSYDYYVFSFSSKFIEHYWEFKDESTIILMGCDSLPQLESADSFHKQGGYTVIGWNGPITITETDEVTLEIIRAITNGGDSNEIVNYINENMFTNNNVKLLISNNKIA